MLTRNTIFSLLEASGAKTLPRTFLFHAIRGRHESIYLFFALVIFVAPGTSNKYIMECIHKFNLKRVAGDIIYINSSLVYWCWIEEETPFLGLGWLHKLIK